MMQRMTKHCQPFIHGKVVTEEELLRWEVERSREALALLRRKIGIARMRELLAEETAASAQVHAQWVRDSHGKWVKSETAIEVRGLTIEELLSWFHERVAAEDQEAMGRACPEHYYVTSTSDGRIDVIETTGGWGVPTHFYVQLGEPGATASPIPADVDTAYPLQMAGRGRLPDGLEFTRVLHQFAPTQDGFKAKLAIYWPVAAAPEMVEGHHWHLACEFTNWVNLCIAHRSRKLSARS